MPTKVKRNVILDEAPVVEEVKKEEPKKKEEVKKEKEGIVTGTSLLNVRKEPNGQVLTTLKEGDKIVILGEEGDWYKFAGGYVMKKYIK